MLLSASRRRRLSIFFVSTLRSDAAKHVIIGFMTLYQSIRAELERLEKTKTFKTETVIESEQGAVVRVAGKDVIMLASNNYLGLASHPRIKDAAIRGVRDFGYGVSSVRFLCGTLTGPREPEEKT